MSHLFPTGDGRQSNTANPGDERITDPATIRTYWEDDEEVTRIVRRVAGALNSGRDKAVVEVVLDETETLRQELALVKDTLTRRTDALNRTGAANDELRAIVERVRSSRDAYQRILDVAIDEQNREWLPVIIGSLDHMLGES